MLFSDTLDFFSYYYHNHHKLWRNKGFDGYGCWERNEEGSFESNEMVFGRRGDKTQGPERKINF